MTKPEFWFPVKPWIVTQKWGVHRPEVYGQFGFEDHNGIDIALGYDKTVRCPFIGRVTNSGNIPGGAGVFCSVVSEDFYTFPDGIECKVYLDALHMEKVTANVGDLVQVGTQLGIADNTGFSTGPHTHFQFRRVKWEGRQLVEIDKNRANNSFNPTPYFNGFFAVDISIVERLFIAVKELAKKVTELSVLIRKR